MQSTCMKIFFLGFYHPWLLFLFLMWRRLDYWEFIFGLAAFLKRWPKDLTLTFLPPFPNKRIISAVILWNLANFHAPYFYRLGLSPLFWTIYVKSRCFDIILEVSWSIQKHGISRFIKLWSCYLDRCFSYCPGFQAENSWIARCTVQFVLGGGGGSFSCSETARWCLNLGYTVLWAVESMCIESFER